MEPPASHREMISGPDLGAGFLFQLTQESASTGSRFVYHAQEGGQDANGPPKGSPEPFGWVRAPGMCSLGGRACWHREFTLPNSEVMTVRAAYNRSRFVMQAQIDQGYAEAEPGLASAFPEWIDRASPVLAASSTPWYVMGPAARWLHGVGPRPTAVEVGTTWDGVRTVAQALREYLIEPAAPTEWDGRPVVAARAFVGTFQTGARIGWWSPDPATRGHDPPLSEWTMLSDGVEPTLVQWAGRTVPLAPVELTLLDLARRGDSEASLSIAREIRKRGVDGKLWDRVARAPGWPAELLPRVLEILSPS